MKKQSKTKLEILLNKKAQFTELIKITNFDNIKNCIKLINKYFDQDEDEGYYTDDKNGKKYNYVYLSGDGQAYFVEQLNEFDEGYRTEQDWGVKHSLPMN